LIFWALAALLASALAISFFFVQFNTSNARNAFVKLPFGLCLKKTYQLYWLVTAANRHRKPLERCFCGFFYGFFMVAAHGGGYGRFYGGFYG